MTNKSHSVSGFVALSNPGFRVLILSYVLAMMADNIEHVISYWMMFQKFHSPELGGFAVLSHWLPFLFFSVPVGMLGERFDPRRLIQIGMFLFAFASLGWGYFFFTDSLQMWQAMVLLVLHGCAGVFWHTSTQILLHDVVTADELPSAVRLLATARYLGILVGPAVGGLMLIQMGPEYAITLNACFYLPTFVWLINAPYGPAFKKGAKTYKVAVRGMSDILITFKEVSNIPVIFSMVLLAGAASFFVGNSYQAQMPAFALDLGHGNPGVSYSMLLAADAAGALLAGLVLSNQGLMRPRARSALVIALLWAACLSFFSLTDSYSVALALLFFAGFVELSFGSMAQTLVQLNAPAQHRGRVIGLFNMFSLGLRAGSGITVGLVGGLIGVHLSLLISALVLIAMIVILMLCFKFDKAS
jgi:MFS family permease